MSERTCGLEWRKDGTGWRLFAGKRKFGQVVFEGAWTGRGRTSHSSSRSAAARSEFLAHDRLAMSLSRPDEH
jgi:hypothetical protein